MKLFATILAGALAGSALALAHAPDAGCALPSEPKGVPAAIDAAIIGPADKDRACMKALLIPEARMMFVSLNSIQAIKDAGGWRVTSIMVGAESATAPLPKEYLP
jgi:hypothetical protein